MMKRIFHIAFYVLLLLAAASCSRHKIISDGKLAQIFHDVFLTNAYISVERVNIDSLKIYEPIFQKYGYTTTDVYYTIGNFSKRKSASLGNVVDKAIKQLESENSYYKREVAVLDTIDNIATRTFSRTIYADSLIRVGTLRDTSRLKLSVDIQPGEYELRLNYFVDSLDRNTSGLNGVVWLEKKDGTRSNVYSTSLRRRQRETFVRRFRADSTHSAMRLDFIQFRSKPQRPSVTVTDLVVSYTPPTQVAVDSLYLRQLNLHIFPEDDLLPADSL